MEFDMKYLFLLGVLFVSTANAHISKVALCDYCNASQSQSKAIITAGSAAHFGVTVYIADFGQTVLRKYFILEDSPLGPVSGKADQPNASITEMADVIRHEVIALGNDNQLLMNVAELQPTATELTDFQEYDWLLDYLASMGITATENIRMGGPPLVGNYNVPPVAGAASAYDVVGNVALARQLGRYAINNNNTISSIARAININGQLGVGLNDVQPIPAIAIKFIFEDGSFGVWTFDNLTDLVAIQDAFVDSDGNPIPLSLFDIAGRIFQFGQGSTNPTRMATRITLIGGSVGGNPSGCSAQRFACGADGRCSTTCLID